MAEHGALAVGSAQDEDDAGRIGREVDEIEPLGDQPLAQDAAGVVAGEGADEARSHPTSSEADSDVGALPARLED